MWLKLYINSSYQDNRIVGFYVVKAVHKFDVMFVTNEITNTGRPVGKKRDAVRKTGIFDRICMISPERRD